VALLFTINNHSHLQKLTIIDCLKLYPFLPGLRASSLPLWLTWFWFTYRSLLLRMTSHLWVKKLIPLWPMVSRTVYIRKKHPSGAYDQIFITIRQLQNCWIKGVLSAERTGLPFTIAAVPRQRSHFRVRVPWDSWPYFTLFLFRCLLRLAGLRCRYSTPPPHRG
jgi:hypothetical protein